MTEKVKKEKLKLSDVTNFWQFLAYVLDHPISVVLLTVLLIVAQVRVSYDGHNWKFGKDAVSFRSMKNTVEKQMKVEQTASPEKK